MIRLLVEPNRGKHDMLASGVYRYYGRRNCISLGRKNILDYNKNPEMLRGKLVIVRYDMVLSRRTMTKLNRNFTYLLNQWRQFNSIIIIITDKIESLDKRIRCSWDLAESGNLLGKYYDLA